MGGGPPWRQWREGAGTRREHARFPGPGSLQANPRGLRSEGSGAWRWWLPHLEAVQSRANQNEEVEATSQSACRTGEVGKGVRVEESRTDAAGSLGSVKGAWRAEAAEEAGRRQWLKGRLLTCGEKV